MTRYGLVGDIHAEDERLAAALAIFRSERVDQVLFVGDVVDGDGDVDRCCSLLAGAGALGVRGNHDRWILAGTMRVLPRAHLREELAPASVALLESLPAVREIEGPRGRMLLCHGVGEDDMQRLRPDDDGYALTSNVALEDILRAGRYAIVIGGHTHERMVKRFAMYGGQVIVVNAGTLAGDAAPCCSVMDLDAGAVRFWDLDEPSAPTPAEQLPLPA